MVKIKIDINNKPVIKEINKENKSRMEDLETWEFCNSIFHNPPMNIVIPSNKKYIHVCSSCGKETVIYGGNALC